MFYIIEKDEQLNKLKEFEDCYVEFIPFSSYYHPKLNQISLIYIRGINSHKGYILCLKHSESLSLKLENVINYLNNKIKKLFVINKKESLYYFNNTNKLFDISFIEIPKLNENNICLNYFNNRLKDNKELNCLIPISKHYEQCESNFKIIKPIIQKYDENDEDYDFKNIISIDSFFYIENQGLQLSKENYLKYFHDKIENPEFNIDYGKIYTQYNLYTSTGRPSNVFNKINFLALKKDNRERTIIIPENDELLEIDINAYHPRIVGEILNYDLPQEKLYETLGIEKEEMFENMYGGVKKNHPFLSRLKEYVDENFNGDYKKLAHYIHKMETYNNVKIIQQIKKYLTGKKSKLVLYVYDSFLFDINYKDDKNIIEKLRSIIKYPTKIKTGSNYHELK